MNIYSRCSLSIARVASDISIYGPSLLLPLWCVVANAIGLLDNDDEHDEDRDSWESISMDARQVGIRTSVLEDKCQAFETLVIHASTLNERFGPYVAQVLELTLPGLRFYIRDVVQEACAMLVARTSSTVLSHSPASGNRLSRSCVPVASTVRHSRNRWSPRPSSPLCSSASSTPHSLSAGPRRSLLSCTAGSLRPRNVSCNCSQTSGKHTLRGQRRSCGVTGCHPSPARSECEGLIRRS